MQCVVMGEMSINSFYTDVLGADLRNSRWSWGSVDPATNRVYLRIWDDECREVNGHEYALLLRPSPRGKSPGYAERQVHVALIQEGAEGYGVVCTAEEPLAEGPRTIKTFDSTHLIEFGPLVELEEGTCALVQGRVPVDTLHRRQTSITTIASDLKAIIRSPVQQTEKEALISARMGQGQFRKNVLALWGHRCAVTETGVIDAIRASHIKPWRASSNDERLDPSNGIPLVATYDALFDAGLITFDATGAIEVSRRMIDSERELLKIGAQGLRRPPSPITASYLQYHRQHVFRC